MDTYPGPVLGFDLITLRPQSYLQSCHYRFGRNQADPATEINPTNYPV